MLKYLALCGVVGLAVAMFAPLAGFGAVRGLITGVICGCLVGIGGRRGWFNEMKVLATALHAEATKYLQHIQIPWMPRVDSNHD